LFDLAEYTILPHIRPIKIDILMGLMSAPINIRAEGEEEE